MAHKMDLWLVGDTTYDSDPTKSHHSYSVYTTPSQKTYYTRVPQSGGTFWRYAHPVMPIGFKVGALVPARVAGRLNNSFSNLRKGR